MSWVVGNMCVVKQEWKVVNQWAGKFKFEFALVRWKSVLRTWDVLWMNVSTLFRMEQHPNFCSNICFSPLTCHPIDTICHKRHTTHTQSNQNTQRSYSLFPGFTVNSMYSTGNHLPFLLRQVYYTSDTTCDPTNAGSRAATYWQDKEMRNNSQAVFLRR